MLLSDPTIAQVNSKWLDKDNPLKNEGYYGVQINNTPLEVSKEKIENARIKYENILNDTSKLLPIAGSLISIQFDLNKYTTEVKTKKGTIKKVTLRASGAQGISLAFSKLKLNAGSELIIYNSDKNYIMGPIVDKDCYNYAYNTDIIPGEVVNIELIDSTGQGNIEMYLDNIGYIYEEEMLNLTENILKSVQTECDHIDVACSEGDDYLLERDAIARIYAPFGDFYYYGSGCLIGNTSYDFTPYFFTCFHNVDLELINGERDCILTNDEKNGTSSWVFRFFWENEYCDGYWANGSASISGATFKAAYLPTDMALVELNDNPDCRYSYLGWDKSFSSPSKVACLHHPNGEPMKISIDNNGANPNNTSKPMSCSYFPIGYAFSINFDEGTIEGGSSGSPILNQNNYVVGQISARKGTILNPCGGESLGGRFSHSWAYGSSSSQRLKEWLDPNNTGAPYVVTKRNAGISGPENICTSGNYQYTLQNAPTGVTITWIATGNFSPSSGTGSTANVYASTSNGSYSKITFNVPHPSKDNFTFSKDVWVGLVSSSSLDISNPYNYPDNTLATDEQNQLIAMCNGVECNVIQDYEWDYSGWSHFEVGTLHNISFVTVPSSFTSKDIKLRAINQCGAGSWRTETFYPGQYSYFSIFPNPSSDYVDICINKSLFDTSIKETYEVRIINSQSMVLNKTTSKENNLRINISHLQNGNYFVLLKYNNKEYFKQLIIKH